MKAICSLVVAASALASAPSVHAQSYGEIGYTNQRITLNLTDGFASANFRATSGTLRGIAGYKIHPNLAMEGLLAVGINDGNIETGNATLDNAFRSIGAVLGVKNAFGVFLKPQFKNSAGYTYYARVGVNRVTLETKGDGVSDSVGKNAFAYGLGVGYDISKHLSVSADWMEHLNKNLDSFIDGTRLKAKSGGIAVSLQYRF
ncbi:MAG: outer membrane beta-barrel protein [Burkholderiaceae bacterium]